MNPLSMLYSCGLSRHQLCTNRAAVVLSWTCIPLNWNLIRGLVLFSVWLTFHLSCSMLEGRRRWQSFFVICLEGERYHHIIPMSSLYSAFKSQDLDSVQVSPRQSVLLLTVYTHNVQTSFTVFAVLCWSCSWEAPFKTLLCKTTACATEKLFGFGICWSHN